MFSWVLPFLSPIPLNFSDLAFIGFYFDFFFIIFFHAFFILAVKYTQTTAASSELFSVWYYQSHVGYYSLTRPPIMGCSWYSMLFACLGVIVRYCVLGLWSAGVGYKHMWAFVLTSLYFSIISCVRGPRTPVGSWIQILDVWCAGGNGLQIVDFSCLSYLCNFMPPGKKTMCVTDQGSVHDGRAERLTLWRFKNWKFNVFVLWVYGWKIIFWTASWLSFPCVCVCVCVCVRVRACVCVCHNPNHILYLPGRVVAAVTGHVYIDTDKFENSNFPLHLALAPSTCRWNFSQSTLHR